MIYNGIEDPMGNGEIIEIKIYISNYIHNKNILAQFSDATVRRWWRALITYKYFPVIQEDGQAKYEYIILRAIMNKIDLYIQIEDT